MTDIPKYTIIEYIRDKSRIPYGVLIAVKSPDGYNIGYSLCNKKDRFNKRMALKIAIGRANFSSDCVDSLPYVIAKKIPTFIERCKKYYKA